VKLEHVTISYTVQYAEVAGEPYAYFGGFIDLAPEKATRIAVGSEVFVEVHDEYGDEYHFNTSGPPKLEWPDLVKAAGAYEEAGQLPPGFQVALAEWFEEAMHREEG